VAVSLQQRRIPAASAQEAGASVPYKAQMTHRP
jgi:hypothetical protein